MKVQGTLPRLTAGLYIYYLHSQILGGRLERRRRGERDYCVPGNPM